MSRSLSSREVIKALKAGGWVRVRVTGDHHQLRHPTRTGTVTVPHPVKDVSIRATIRIEHQSGLDLRRQNRCGLTMGARYYPTVIDRSASGFGITFPDLPGCVSAGRTLEDTIERGHEALAAHLELILEHGEPVPEPSQLDQIEDDGVGEIVLKTLVRADLPGRTVRLSITMDEALASTIDRAAAAQGFTRSGSGSV